MGLAQRVATGMFLLFAPYLLSLVLDLILYLLGFQGVLLPIVAPMYVLAIQLTGITISMMFIFVDWAINLLIAFINVSLRPLKMEIAYRSNLSRWVYWLSQQMSETILQYTSLMSVAGKVALDRR